MKTKPAVLVLVAVVALFQAATSISQTSSGSAGTAVLSVASGFATQPGAANPLAGSPLVLFNEGFENSLRRRGVFEGPPGSTVKASPLAAWAYACKTGSPVCKHEVLEMRPNSVSEARMDINGKAALPGVPAGTYYLFTVANYNNQFLVWDLRVDLKPGANSVTLTQANSAPLDADSARAKQPAANQPVAGSKPCQVTDEPRSAKAGVRGNSLLSLIGTGYTYTYTRTDRTTGRVLDSFTERGNFSNTDFYLLDEDAEIALQRGGVEPGLLGSRFATMLFIENTTLLEPGKLNEIAPVPLLMLGGEKMAAEMAGLAKTAKADFDCAMKAIRAHSVGQMTTNANARGTFPAVPAGTYYLYGRFFRTQKPVRTGGLVWNLRIEVKPGQNTKMLAVNDAAWKQP